MDSPLCPKCLEEGVISHTYRVAGRVASSYKCQSCKLIHSSKAFVNEDFLWKSDFNSWAKARKIEHVDEGSLERIKDIANGNGRKPVKSG